MEKYVEVDVYVAYPFLFIPLRYGKEAAVHMVLEVDPETRRRLPCLS